MIMIKALEVDMVIVIQIIILHHQTDIQMQNIQVNIQLMIVILNVIQKDILNVIQVVLTDILIQEEEVIVILVVDIQLMVIIIQQWVDMDIKDIHQQEINGHNHHHHYPLVVVDILHQLYPIVIHHVMNHIQFMLDVIHLLMIQLDAIHQVLVQLVEEFHLEDIQARLIDIQTKMFIQIETGMPNKIIAFFFFQIN